MNKTVNVNDRSLRKALKGHIPYTKPLLCTSKPNWYFVKTLSKKIASHIYLFQIVLRHWFEYIVSL